MEDPASSFGGRSNNDTSNAERGTLAIPILQSPEGRLQRPMMTNLGQTNQGTVNPASAIALPASTTSSSNSVLLSSMLEIYQIPPFSSLSLEQIATAVVRASEAPAPTTPMQGILSRPLQGVYSALPLQHLELASSTGPAPCNTLGNSSSVSNPPSHNNQAHRLSTEALGNSVRVGNRDDQDAQSTEPNHSNCNRVLSMPQDEENLSKYQCLVRQQIEMFQTTEEDLTEKSQGRNRPIVLGQVGIRCRHCGRIPAKERARGGKFFPSNLDALYQTAQNMANTHLLFTCTEIPAAVREDMLRLRSKDKGSKTCKSAYGSGRSYWSTCLRVQGVIDTQDRRLFLSNTLKQTKHGPPAPL